MNVPEMYSGQEAMPPGGTGDEQAAEHLYYTSFLQGLKNHFGTSAMSAQQVQAAADVEFDAAMTALQFNLVMFVMLMGGYELFSRLVPSVYAGKRHHVDLSSKMAVDLPRSYLPLGWIPAVARTSWNTVLKTGGLDAYMFLRYIRMCLVFSTVAGFWGMCILWPLFASGGNNEEGWYRLSMANLTQGSWRLWFPAIFMWLTSFYVFFLMNEEFKHWLQLRTDFLAHGDADTHTQRQYSLIVERIPHELRSDRALYEYFDALFPGRVFSACVVLNLPQLEKLSAKRQQAVRRLEKSVAFYEATGKRGTHVVGRSRVKVFGIESLPIIPSPVRRGRDVDELDDDLIRVTATDSLPKKGERVDSINYYTRLLVDMNTTIEKMQVEKKELAAKGNDQIRASQWMEHKVALAHDSAVRALGGKQKSRRSDGLVLDFRRGGTGQKFSSVVHTMGLDFLFGCLSYANRKIDVVVDSVVGTTHSSTGFVTFKDMGTLTCAVRAPLSSDPNVLEVAVANEPRDIKWENAHINLDWSAGRAASANVLLFLGAILWSIPVAAIQAIANIDSLATIPGLGWIGNVASDKFQAFLNAYLPVVALLCIILLLPMAFEWISVSYELRKTESDVQRAILGRYFYYQLANVYVTVTAGSLWDSLGEMLDHPSAAFEILGLSLPKCVGYFVTLIITKTFAGLPMVLLRFHALSRMFLLKLCFNQKLLTQRELDEVHKKETLWYGWEYPTQLLVIVICFTYACISPVILPVSAIYFLGALLIYKKQVLIVYAAEYESGGELFPTVCHRTLVGLICGQVTLIGYSILREGFYQPLVLFPLPIISILMMRVFQRLYTDPGKYLSLERAMQLDKHATDELTFGEDTYRQPVLAEKAVEPQAYRKTNNISDDDSVSATSVRSARSSRQDTGIMHNASTSKIV